MGATGSPAPAGGAARASRGGPRARSGAGSRPSSCRPRVGRRHDAGRRRGLVGADAARRGDGAGRLPGRRAGGGASPGPGPRPARSRAGLPRRRPAQARFHRHRRRLPGRVGGVARARRGLPRSAVRRRRRPGGRSRGRPLWPGRAARLAVDGRDRARGPRALHGRPGFRPDPRGLDPRPARGRPGRSPVGQRGPRAARRAAPGPRPRLDVTGRPRSTTPATGPGPAHPAHPPRARAWTASAGPARSSSMRARPGWAAIACWTSWAREARGSSIAPRTRPRASIVAIKVLRTDRSDHAMGLRRFRKEARLQAAANNPHVVNLLEYNEEDGIPYLVLEFVSGEGLDRLLRRRGPARRTRGPGDHGRGRARPDGRPRARDRPPRHQAEQHPPAHDRPGDRRVRRDPLLRGGSAPRASRARDGGSGPHRAPRDGDHRIPGWGDDRGIGPRRAADQDLGLRAGPPRRRHRIHGPDRRRRPAGHAPLHGPRAMDGPGDRCADGCLCHGRHALPPAGGPAAVRRPDARRPGRAALQRAAPAARGGQPGRQRGGRAGGGAGHGQAPRGSLRRRRGDAPRPGGPAARRADRHPDASDPAGLRPGSGPAVRVPMGAGILAATALAAGDQHRPARPGDRVPRDEVHDPVRGGPRRPDLRRGPQGGDDGGRRGAPLRMGRAAADGRDARVQPGPVRLAGQLRRAVAAGRGRHDAGPPPAPRAADLDDPRRLAMGGRRRPAQEPGEGLSPDRRDPAGPGRSRRRRVGRGRSVRGAGSPAGRAAPSARAAAGPAVRSGRRRRRSSSGWASTWSAGRPRRSRGSGRWPWPIGSGSIPTRSSPPACTAPARACSSCTGTCSARSAGSPARSPTRSARSPSTPTARPATSTSGSTSPTRSS